MQTVIWEPTEVNLATVKELEHFNVSVTCYVEEDINNQIVKKYLDITFFPIDITVDTIQYSIKANPGVISGYYKAVFDDTLIFQQKDLSKKTITTLSSEPIGQSVFEKIKTENVLGITGFIPDPIRHKVFRYSAIAYDNNTQISEKEYTITVSDRNWDNGKNNFIELVKKYENE
jgi:hypothetical protein